MLCCTQNAKYVSAWGVRFYGDKLISMKEKILNYLTNVISHDGHDLSLVDNIFAIFVAVTLALTFESWISKHLYIIIPVFVSVAVLIVSLMVTVNLNTTKKLWLGYLVSLVLSFLSYEYIMWASNNDLAPEYLDLLALPYGVVMWIFCRELAVIITNIVRSK